MLPYHTSSEWFPETQAEFRERIRQVKAMTYEERIQEGIRRYEKECAMRKQAIRDQHPDMAHEEVEECFIAQEEAQQRIEAEQKAYCVEVLGLIP